MGEGGEGGDTLRLSINVISLPNSRMKKEKKVLFIAKEDRNNRAVFFFHFALAIIIFFFGKRGSADMAKTVFE